MHFSSDFVKKKLLSQQLTLVSVMTQDFTEMMVGLLGVVYSHPGSS